MTERLTKIEASLEATAAICGSNARAIQATGEQVAALSNRVDAFIQKIDSEGLRVTLITEMADDMGGDVSYLEREKNRQDASIEALRQDAIADRQAFREALEADRQKAEADRTEWRSEMAAARAEWQQSFSAQQEVLQRLLLEIRSTNGDVSRLSSRIDDIQAS